MQRPSVDPAMITIEMILCVRSVRLGNTAQINNNYHVLPIHSALLAMATPSVPAWMATTAMKMMIV